MKINHNLSVRQLTLAAMIAAVYAALTMLLEPFSFGVVQLRVSEALTILPIFTAAAIPGLAIGCLIANALSGAMLLDVVFGTLATLAAAFLTHKLRKNTLLATLPPVILNGIVVGLLLKYVYAVELPLILCMGSVALGQLAACTGLGTLLATALRKLPDSLWR